MSSIPSTSRILLCVFILSAYLVQAHSHHPKAQHHQQPKLTIDARWNDHQGNALLDGSILFVKNDTVRFETSSGALMLVPMHQLGKVEQQKIQLHQSKIAELNQSPALRPIDNDGFPFPWNSFLGISLIILTFGVVLPGMMGYRKAFLRLGQSLSFIAVVIAFFAFQSKGLRKQSINSDPAQLAAAFAPFSPYVNTFSDNTWFYVESRGIPHTHTMMAGISNHGWQRQVPIPQCYMGTNAWQIPLNPTIAAAPTPVNPQHFSRGAIGIAVNGVPIFNPYTNTGVDAYLDGQLDTYGGHSGRGDDYHYHTAPLHLQAYTTSALPIAYAFDGFAVYGNLEPEGSTMMPLDTNNGHFGMDGVYHYHGVNQAPYMIRNFAGVVTEDATHQLIPQAQAHPVRPGQNPLNGALITDHYPLSGGNGYVLKYTLAGANDSIVYSWNGSGQYHFQYYSPNGTLDSLFNGFVQCDEPGIVTKNVSPENTFRVWYTAEQQAIQVLGSWTSNAPWTLYGMNGQQIRQYPAQTHQMDISDQAKGVYFLVHDGICYRVVKW